MPTTLGDPDALVAEIKQRAHQRAIDIEEDARKQAARIFADAEKERDSIRRQYEIERQQELAALVRSTTVQGEREARRRYTMLRETEINRVWSAAELRLRELIEQPSYRDVLKSLAMRAAHELGEKQFILVADPVGHVLLSRKTLEEWSKEAGVQFGLAQQPGDTWGGLLATSGRTRFDATFPTQLGVAQVVLREKVFELLSGNKS